MAQGPVQVLAGLDEIGPDLQRRPIVLDRFVKPAADCQCVAEAVVDLREVGLNCQRLLKLGDGLIPTTPFGEGKPDVVVGYGEIGPRP